MKRGIFFLLMIVFIFPTVLSAQDETIPNAQVSYMDTRLMVRNAPFLDAAAVGYIDAGKLILIVGRSEDNLWLETTAENGRVGWVNADFVRVVQDLPNIPVTHSRNILGYNIYLSEDIIDNIRRIYLLGQANGNQSNVFSKVGDSITVAPHMYAPIASEEYNAGNFYYFQDTVDHFLGGSAREGNSFENISLAAKIGWSAGAVLNPKYADENLCYAGESPLLCEYRQSNPAFALIMFGTNDVGFTNAYAFENNLEQIVEITIAQNIVPIISTIPPRKDFENQVDDFNLAIRRVADNYYIPLWDYGSAMRALPGNGLDADGIHPSIPPMGMRGSADFRTYNLNYGYVIRNLTALQMLDTVWTAAQGE